jgi:hypothetical protein
MGTLSDPVEVVAPRLQGVWIHDPQDPQGTIRQYAFINSQATEARSLTGAALSFAGRAFPVFEFGDLQQRTAQLSLMVPVGTEWGAQLASLEDLLLSKRSWVYRDNRGRLLFGAVMSVSITDDPRGTVVDLTLTATEFDESVATGSNVVTLETLQAELGGVTG